MNAVYCLSSLCIILVLYFSLLSRKKCAQHCGGCLVSFHLVSPQTTWESQVFESVCVSIGRNTHLCWFFFLKEGKLLLIAVCHLWTWWIIHGGCWRSDGDMPCVCVCWCSFTCVITSVYVCQWIVQHFTWYLSRIWILNSSNYIMSLSNRHVISSTATI